MSRSNPKENWGCHGYLCTVQTLGKMFNFLFVEGGGGGGPLL
jgi:hypothetical protein